MGEEEDFFNDDILNDDLLEALVKEESQYINTQSNRENDINSTANIDPLYKERQQLTKAFSSAGSIATITTIRDAENDTRSNWEPMDISDPSLSQQQENNIIKLQSIIERLESRLKQEELDHRFATQKLNSMKTTLVFKEQELESMRTELKESKKKIQSNEKEWMDIDQENAVITNNSNIINNNNNNNNNNKNFNNNNIDNTTTAINNNDTERPSHRKNFFPSVSEFNIIPRQKRQRTMSTSPSISPSPFIREPSVTPSIIRESSVTPSVTRESSIAPLIIREPSAAPSNMHESSVSWEQEGLERKQRHEDTKASIDRAVKKALNNQQEKIIKKIESKRLHKEQQEIQDFYNCILTIKYLKNTLQDIVIQKPIQLSEMTDICEKLTNQLRPSKTLTETDSKLNALATDLFDCILQATGVTVKSTLVQILDIIKLLIKLCIGEKKNLIFYHVIQILNALVMGYKELPTSLYQEMIRYNEESILYSIVKGLTLVHLDNNDGQTNKSHIIFALPDLKTIRAKDINIILKEYQFGSSDKRQLLTNVTFSQAQETVVNILDIISYVCCTHMVSAERFLFLLDQYEFTSLISTRKPFSTSIKALALLNLLTVYGSSKWLYDEKYHTLLKMIASFMILPRPSDVHEVQWYKVRILAIAICETIMTSVPIPISFDDAFELVFTPLLYILNNECLCLQDVNKPPYHSVPTKESDKLIIDTISLMNKTLEVYPDILICEDGDVYIQTLSALKGASTIINEKWSLDHEVALKFREIGKLLHIRQKTMMES